MAIFTESDVRAIGRMIKERRVSLGLSARQLAEAVGVSDAHIIYIEKGQREAAFGKIIAILDALGMSVSDVLDHLGLGQRGNVEPARLGSIYRVPVVTLVTAGRWREVCDAFEPGDADEWIETDVKGRNVFALRVTGDSMEPEFKDGEVIIVNPHVEALPNDFVVVKNRSGEATFKQLKKYGAKWVLHPLNPRYGDVEVKRGDFKIIGRVVKKEKRY
jgi:SOS-response transcriptional repressor LexA